MKRTAHRRYPGGFTLIEVVVVLLIFGIVLAMAAALTRGVVASQKRSLTATRISGVEAALVQFVQQQRRLPCPADGTIPASNTDAGKELVTAGTCTGNQQNGVVPFRSLGLSEADVTDGWDRRLTYRVDPTRTANGGMDMTWCDPAGQEGSPTFPAVALCNTACSSTNLANCTPPVAFLKGKGLMVKNVAATVLMDPTAAAPTGAAYVLISHGETGGGAYVNSGTLTASSLSDGTEEQKNYANLALQAYYVDDSLTETSGTGHFDDVVSRPSVMSVISKAGLGPRQH